MDLIASVLPIRSTRRYVKAHRHGKGIPRTEQDGHRCDPKTVEELGWLDVETGEVLDAIPAG